MAGGHRCPRGAASGAPSRSAHDTVSCHGTRERDRAPHHAGVPRLGDWRVGSITTAVVIETEAKALGLPAASARQE